MKNEKSDPIEWDEAITQIKRYRENEHNDAIPHFSVEGEILKGFEIDADSLREILNNIEGKTIDKVYLNFGRHDRIGAATTLSAIFFGATESGEILKADAFDYCEPCPFACSAELEQEIAAPS